MKPKKCKSCSSEIPHDARKCVHCGSFQDYRRYLNVSSTVLALIVAIITSTVALIPIYDKYYAEHNSKVFVKANPIGHTFFVKILKSSIDTIDDRISYKYQSTLAMNFEIIISNYGSRYGFVNKARLSVRRVDSLSYAFPGLYSAYIPIEPNVIYPSDPKFIEFHLQDTIIREMKIPVNSEHLYVPWTEGRTEIYFEYTTTDFLGVTKDTTVWFYPEGSFLGDRVNDFSEPLDF